MQGIDKHLINVDIRSIFIKETEGCERINWRKKVCELHITNFKSRRNSYTATCEYETTSATTTITTTTTTTTTASTTTTNGLS